MQCLRIAMAEIWRATAIMVVILVTGIGPIPKEYDEATKALGASRRQRFRKITLPLMHPLLQMALALRIILAFEVFAVVAAPGCTLFPVLRGQTCEYPFDLNNCLAAVAMALTILAISIGFTLLVLHLLRVPTEARIYRLPPP